MDEGHSKTLPQAFKQKVRTADLAVEFFAYTASSDLQEARWVPNPDRREQEPKESKRRSINGIYFQRALSRRMNDIVQ